MCPTILLCVQLSYQVSYYPTLRETGAVFVCRWQQLAKVGCHLSYHNHHPSHDDDHHHQIMIMLQTGELLYSGEERAPPLLVLLPPEVRYRRPGSNCLLTLTMTTKVLPEVATSLVWRPGLTISAPIRARPKPQVTSSSPLSSSSLAFSTSSPLSSSWW